MYMLRAVDSNCHRSVRVSLIFSPVCMIPGEGRFPFSITEKIFLLESMRISSCLLVCNFPHLSLNNDRTAPMYLWPHLNTKNTAWVSRILTAVVPEYFLLLSPALPACIMIHVCNLIVFWTSYIRMDSNARMSIFSSIFILKLMHTGFFGFPEGLVHVRVIGSFPFPSPFSEYGMSKMTGFVSCRCIVCDDHAWTCTILAFQTGIRGPTHAISDDLLMLAFTFTFTFSPSLVHRRWFSRPDCFWLRNESP